MQKLLRPLEPVEEEVECSELTTPASEAVDMTPERHNKKNVKGKQSDEKIDDHQTSIMSSHNNSTHLIETAQTASDLHNEVIQKLMIDSKVVPEKIKPRILQHAKQPEEPAFLASKGMHRQRNEPVIPEQSLNETKQEEQGGIEPKKSIGQFDQSTAAGSENRARLGSAGLRR